MPNKQETEKEGKRTICAKCGEKLKITVTDSGNNEAECEKCRITTTVLNKEPLKKFVCLGDICRGNTIIISLCQPINPVICPISGCGSIEIFEVDTE